MSTITSHPEPRSNRLAIWLSAAILFAALAWFGHRLVFAQFQDYDDEGYLLLTVQQFLRGLPVYDEIYTQYGPAYYLWQQVLHTLIGIPVTHDATRVVTIVVWLTSAALVGAIVWLLTNRRLLTVIATAVAFLHLTQLTFEPGHPQELCLLGVLGAVALTTWRLVVRKQLGTAGSIGVWVLVAVTALTKVNVGALLVTALTLGLVTSLRSRWRTVVERVVIAASLVAVPALMRGDLVRGDVAASVVVLWSALLAAFISRSDDVAEEGMITARDLLAGATAFTIGCAAIVSAIVFEGTSLRALLNALFVAPLLLPKVFWRPLPVPLLVAVVAPVSLLAAMYWRRGVIGRERWVYAAAQACGLLMFLLSIAKMYRVLFAVAPLLVWLALADRARSSEQRAALRILAFAAILMLLQAYPMPDGTQIVVGTVLFVPLAIAMIAGVEQDHGSHERSVAASRWLGRRAILATLAVAVVTNLGFKAQRLYAAGIPLAMPGAWSVRSTARDVATYQWLTANIRENCDAFITAPGLNSLHFWTEMAPLSTLNTTLWPLLFDADQQRRILMAAERVERLCVAWSPQRMEALTSAPDTASRPLVAWLRREFEPRGRVGDWELRMRRGRPARLIYEGRRVRGGDIVLGLPSLGHGAAGRIDIVDVDTPRPLGDSARSGELVVLDEQGAPAFVDGGVEISHRRRLTIRSAITQSSSDRHVTVVRLWARDGRALALVPVVEDDDP